jgi:hypothetical protein
VAREHSGVALEMMLQPIGHQPAVGVASMLRDTALFMARSLCPRLRLMDPYICLLLDEDRRVIHAMLLGEKGLFQARKAAGDMASEHQAFGYELWRHGEAVVIFYRSSMKPDTQHDA